MYGLEEDDGGNPGDVPIADDVEQAARLANAHSFITEWPQGYEPVCLPLIAWAIADGVVDGAHALALAYCLVHTLSSLGAVVLLHNLTLPYPALPHMLPGPQDCGEKGTTISGGQRQRVCMQNFVSIFRDTVSCFPLLDRRPACRLAIARALVRRPSVLLLDEVCTPTSVNKYHHAVCLVLFEVLDS